MFLYKINKFFLDFAGYSWLLMYRRNCMVEKQYMVTIIDHLNLKVELIKNTLAKKIENLTEVDVKYIFFFKFSQFSDFFRFSIFSEVF